MLLISQSLIQQPPLGFRQGHASDFFRNLVPEFLHQADFVVGRQFAESRYDCCHRMSKDFTPNRFFLYHDRFWYKKNRFFDESLLDPSFQSGIRAPWPGGSENTARLSGMNSQLMVSDHFSGITTYQACDRLQWTKSTFTKMNSFTLRFCTRPVN